MGSIPECTASLGRRQKQARGCLCSACPQPEPPKVQHPQRTALGGHTEEVGPTAPEGARSSSSLPGFWQATLTC